MNVHVERLVRIAAELKDELTSSRQLILDGPLNSIRVWTDALTGEVQFQLKGYWPAGEIADKADDQLRQLLQSWQWLPGPSST